LYIKYRDRQKGIKWKKHREKGDMEKEIRGRVDSIFIKELRRPAPEAPVLHGTRITHTLLRDTVPTQRCFKTGWDRL